MTETLDSAAAARLANEIVFCQLNGVGIALLTSADEEGKPHATWMATVAPTGKRQFVTLTSPDSRKVANIRSNPKVEWLFSSPDRFTMVYTEGSAQIILSPEEIRFYWNLMKQKDQAFFLDSYNSGMGFAIVRTEVDAVSLVLPRDNRKFSIDLDEFWNSP